MSSDAPARELIEGRPVLVVVDIQGGAPSDGGVSALPFMPGYGERMANAPTIVEAARRGGGCVPCAVRTEYLSVHAGTV